MSKGQSGDAAELVGKPEALPRTKLLQQLKKHYLGLAAFRVEEGRRARLVARRDHEREAGRPARWGVSVERGRIEVRFDVDAGPWGRSASRRSRRSTVAAYIRGARRGDGGGDIDLGALDVELPRGFGQD